MFPMKRKMFIFRNNKRISQGWTGQTLELEILQQADIGRLLFLTLILGCTAFANSAYPENWALFHEAQNVLATKKNGCSQGNCTSLSALNKKFLGTFKFVSKINEFSSKIPPIPHNFHAVFMCEAKMYFRSFLKPNSYLKIFCVILVSNCCSASLPSVYLAA